MSQIKRTEERRAGGRRQEAGGRRQEAGEEGGEGGDEGFRKPPIPRKRQMSSPFHLAIEIMTSSSSSSPSSPSSQN